MTTRDCSSSWSVYDGEWESHSQEQLAPLTSAFPLQSLKDCGVKKIELIRRGAQGAVYKARDTQRDRTGDQGCVSRFTHNILESLDCNPLVYEHNNETEQFHQEEQEEQQEEEKVQSKAQQVKKINASIAERNLCAVKRIFTQQNDFGRRGIADTVLREVTLLKYINKIQENAVTTGEHENISLLQIKEPAKVIALDRVVEAPHRELCMIMELCALDLRRVFILHRSSQSMYSPNYNQVSSPYVEAGHCTSLLSAQTGNMLQSDTNVRYSCDYVKNDVLMHRQQNTIAENKFISTKNKFNVDCNAKTHLEMVEERACTGQDTDGGTEENSSLLQIQSTSLPSQLPLIRYLFRRICRVVYFLHKYCNVIHRDLKLSNILVTDKHELRLSDFGSARFIDGTTTENRCSLSKSLQEKDREIACEKTLMKFAKNECNQSANEVVSKRYHDLLTPSSMRTTLLYQSPESLLGEAIVPTALDVWSLGVILAELILQKHLFHANSELGMISAIWKLIGNGNTKRSTPSPMLPTLEKKELNETNVTYIDSLTTPSEEEGEEEEKKVKTREVEQRNDENSVTDSIELMSCGTLNLKFPPSLLPECGLDLLRRMLCLNPLERISLEDVLIHPFLHFTDEEDDDKVGQQMWHEKVNMTLQEEVSTANVQMPILNMSEEDESEDSGCEGNDINKLSYNYAYHCITNNNNDNNYSDDDSYEIDLPQIHLHLSQKH